MIAPRDDFWTRERTEALFGRATWFCAGAIATGVAILIAVHGVL